MKIKFYIRDVRQTLGDYKPFYYQRYSTSDGNWTANLSLAYPFYTEHEALQKVEQLVKEENGEYEIVTTYS